MSNTVLLEPGFFGDQSMDTKEFLQNNAHTTLQPMMNFDIGDQVSDLTQFDNQPSLTDIVSCQRTDLVDGK